MTEVLRRKGRGTKGISEKKGDHVKREPEETSIS